jgi:hypothetical protein
MPVMTKGVKSSVRKTCSVPLLQRPSFGEDRREGTGEGHPDRGGEASSSLAREPGSAIGEPEKGKSVHAISN